MKKHLLLILLFLFVIQTNSQTGSGTITFQTTNGHISPITATATSLLNGAITYNISGDTNTPIAFGNYNLTSTLSVQNEMLMKNLQVFGNPNNQLNAILKVNDPNSVEVKIIDITGKEVSTPNVTLQPNGTVQIFDSLRHLSAGMYVVQILFDGYKGSFKLLKNEQQINTSSIKQKSVQAHKTNAVNYNISWANIPGYLDGNQDVEIVSGNTNNIIVDVAIDPEQTGDVAILTYLKGLGKNQVTITAKNTITPDSTYVINTNNDEYALFENIYVSDASNPTSYEFTIVDNAADGTFIETIQNIDIYQDLNYEVNGNKTINLNEFSDNQLVTMVVRDESLSKKSGVTVKMYNSSNSVLDTQTTDGNGEAQFNAPENSSVHFSSEGTNLYKKTNGDYSTPSDIVLESQTSTTLDMVAAAKRNYEDGTSATAAELQRYYPLAWNISAIVGNMDIYHPDDVNKQQYIDHFNEVATQLDRTGMFDVATTPFAQPTSTQINGMNPYAAGRQLYTGQVGYNVDDVGGTSTGVGQTGYNGLSIIWYSQLWKLGGTDWARTDHEIGWMLGFPALSSTATFKTSRDIRAGESVPIANSKWDKTSMDFWLDLGGNHFNGYEYSIVKKVE